MRLMAHWHSFTTITIINEDFLNKKLLLSIVVALTQNSLNAFIKILPKIYQWNSSY